MHLISSKTNIFTQQIIEIMIKHILFTILTLTQFTLAQEDGSLRFTNYAEDRQSAFSFTFDDGLFTHTENVRPILDEHEFKGTFYVLPPYLAESLPGIWRYGTWPGFQAMALDGHEIGSHTMNHYDLTSLQWGDVNDDSTLLYELYQSKIFIEQKIPSQKCISLNYPFTLHNSVIDSAASLFYENGRTLGQVPNDLSLNGEEWYGLKAKVVEFNLPRNSVDDDLDELYAFIDWTQNSIDNNKWGMIIIHDVVPFNSLDSLLGQIYEPIATEWLGWLCDWAAAKSNNKQLWVETVGNITRYIKERDNSVSQIISSSNQLIEINVSDNLNDAIYNYPLSAYIKIPNTWEYVRTEQNGIVDTLTTMETDSGKVVLAKVIPDFGNLKLTPITATAVDDENTNVKEFKLYQNYPNPFNPITTINYTIAARQFVQLNIYDVLGSEISTLVNEVKEPGSYELQFDGSVLSSGIYLYVLKVETFVETKKMVLLR